MSEKVRTKRQLHNIEPVYDSNSQILILGSFPSVKSREEVFFYAHPQNRFWKIMKSLYNEKKLDTICDKKEFLLRNRIALWDVIASGEIKGSSDSSIKVLKVNDVEKIIKQSRIEKIFVNGKTAKRYYDKYLKDRIGKEAICLPSSSPANAVYTFEKLLESWKIICE